MFCVHGPTCMFSQLNHNKLLPKPGLRRHKHCFVGGLSSVEFSFAAGYENESCLCVKDSPFVAAVLKELSRPPLHNQTSQSSPSQVVIASQTAKCRVSFLLSSHTHTHMHAKKKYHPTWPVLLTPAAQPHQRITFCLQKSAGTRGAALTCMPSENARWKPFQETSRLCTV